MAKVLIVYHSRGGNTEKMAHFVAEGVNKEGIDVEVKRVQDTDADELLKVEGLILGSPCYYGAMAGEIKAFLDKSVKHHGKLDGKIGGAFATSANLGGGNETTVMNILQALLIHGMIVQGNPQGAHYGPVTLGTPDEKSSNECRMFGERIAKLVKNIHG